MSGARPIRVAKDGRTWSVAEQDDVSWVVEDTARGREISAAVPLLFDAYATIVTPDDRQERVAAAHALLKVLQRHTAAQPWWLGYLETGASELVFPDVARCELYYGWRCIGGPGALIQDLTDDVRLLARRVTPGEDATPPGHETL